MLSSGAEASRWSRRRVWECPGGEGRACGGAVVGGVGVGVEERGRLVVVGGGGEC